MTTIILTIIIFAEVLLTLAITRDYMAPAFIFSTTFLLAILNYASNLNRWGGRMSVDTMMVILVGVTTYILVSVLVQSVDYRKNIIHELDNNLSIITYRKNVIVLFMIFEVIISFLFAKQIILVTARYGTDGSLSSAVSMYQYLSKFTTLSFNIPSYILYSYILVTSSGYIFGYILVNNYLSTKKIDSFLVLPWLVSITSCFLTGSRGEFIRIILLMIVFYVVRKNNYINNIKQKIRTFSYLILSFILLVVSFEWLAKLMGRDASLKMYDYISVYLGAPIENLNKYLRELATIPVLSNGTFGENTFREQFNWIYKLKGSTGKVVELNPPMNYSNGYNLGNVYTTFKFFFADGKIWGVILFTAIMAIILQVLYDYLKNKRMSSKVEIAFLIYGYLFSGMMLSFFSNRFYESITIVFLERIFCWVVLSRIMVKNQ